MDWDEVRDRVFTTYGDNSYAEGLEIIRQARTEAPERDSLLTFWEACFLSLDGQPQEAFDALEAGLERGLFWDFRMLADPEARLPLPDHPEASIEWRELPADAPPREPKGPRRETLLRERVRILRPPLVVLASLLLGAALARLCLHERREFPDQLLEPPHAEGRPVEAERHAGTGDDLEGGGLGGQGARSFSRSAVRS